MGWSEGVNEWDSGDEEREGRHLEPEVCSTAERENSC